jgi:hypothetical protein
MEVKLKKTEDRRQKTGFRIQNGGSFRIIFALLARKIASAPKSGCCREHPYFAAGRSFYPFSVLEIAWAGDLAGGASARC